MCGFDSRHPLHTRKALQHKRIRLDFPSRSTFIHVRDGTRAITRALSHLGECPWRLSVPKLTVRLQFPPPAPNAKSVVAEPYSRVSVLFRTRVSVHARATLGHTYPHLGTHLQLQRTLSLFRHVLRLFGFPVFQRRPGSVSASSRSMRRAQLQRRERST